MLSDPATKLQCYEVTTVENGNKFVNFDNTAGLHRQSVWKAMLSVLNLAFTECSK